VNWKFLISAAVMFVMLFAIGWGVHGTLLKEDYARIPTLVRPMADVRANFLYVLAAQICTAVAFTWIYLKGREGKPWLAQGIRYGVAVAILMTIPASLVHYAVMPFPLELVLKQMSFDVATIVAMGVVLAWINR
jgi:MFS superfamily sulfate permease-like transporter